jgi:hypothetical protein
MWWKGEIKQILTIFHMVLFAELDYCADSYNIPISNTQKDANNKDK